MKFKIGDIVTCKQKYKNVYGLTIPGVHCTIMDTTDDDIKVRIIEDNSAYWVDAFHFKLVNRPTKEDKFLYHMKRVEGRHLLKKVKGSTIVYDVLCF